MTETKSNDSIDPTLTFDYLDEKASERRAIDKARQIYLENGGLITRREKDGTIRKLGLVNGVLQPVTV